MQNDTSIKKNTTTYFICKYSTVFINLLISAVLSRLLLPSDFGVVAIISVFTSFFHILADMGMGTAVIQHKNLSDPEVNDIFVFTLYFGILLGIIFGVFSFLVAFIYSNTVYVPLGWILSISIFFNTANMIPNALMMKNKKFQIVGFRIIIVSVVVGIITVCLSLAGLKYYALVIQSVLNAFFTFIWNFKSVKLKIRLKSDLNSIKKIRQFSTFTFLFQCLNYFARNLDNLLIGRILGGEKLAYYDKGYKLMLYPIQNITYVINPIIHPILSEYQDNKEIIYKQYIKVVKILSLIGVFITAICFWSSEEFIIIIFGRQWEGAVTTFRILSVSVWAQLVSSSAGAIYQSIGNTKLMFKSGLIHTFISISLIIIGCMLGDINKVALMVTISLLIKFFIEYFFLIKKGLEHTLFHFLRNFIPDLGIFVILNITLGITSAFESINLYISLLRNIGIGGIIYLILLIVFSQMKYILLILPNKIRTKFKNK